jgi:cell division protein FtsL
MNNLTHIVNKVKQAPWRVQRQWIGLLLLGVVMAAMVAGIYINVSAKAAINGRQIQLLTSQIETRKQENADMETKLAQLTASEAMQVRAEMMGFQPATTEEIIYIKVEGFPERTAVDLSLPASDEQSTLMKSEYMETLFDWFTRQMTSPGVTP